MAISAISNLLSQDSLMWQLINDAGAWDNAMRKLPSPHVLQSWAWGEFKSRWGWAAERWLLTGAQAQPRAAVQLLRRSISKLPACVLYAPKGPVSIDLEAHGEALAFIEQRARHHRAIWAKADGDLLPSPAERGRGWGWGRSARLASTTPLAIQREPDSIPQHHAHAGAA